MDSQNKQTRRQKTKVSSIMEMLAENVGVENDTVDTDIAWLKDYEEEMLAEMGKEGDYVGVSTGYQSIDNLIGSFLPGELFTLGGDTGHGKSLLAMNIAQNVYAKEQKPVLFVNLELTTKQATKRFYDLSGADHDYAGIMIQKASQVNYKDIDVIMQKAKEQEACLVVIDHLHFFNDAIGDNAASALTRIVKHFKELAVQHELPVLLLSHVTPTAKADGTMIKPSLHNFKGSRSIEQLSDLVGFVYRAKDQPEGSNEVEFYVRKNRSRPLNEASTYLTQKGWLLKEDLTWVPERLL